MNNFFTHPMRPFFVGAAILAIVGALSFFISPDDLILHRKIFLEFMLPAAYGGFLTASMLEWTNYKGNLKPIAPNRMLTRIDTNITAAIFKCTCARNNFRLSVMA
jgi:uncharacterized protein involved in response to NO